MSEKTAVVSDVGKDRRARLQELRQKMNEGKRLNRQGMVDEDKKSKLPANWEAKQERKEKMLADDKERTDCKERGEDYDIVKMREWTAEEVDQWEQRRKRKKNPDEGFADFEQAAFRKYKKLANQLKPNMEEYHKEKAKLGDDVFYAGINTIGTLEHKDSSVAKDRLVADLEKQAAKRAKFSRRRIHDDDADIDFINERNMKFNKKLERFYGQYTTEIKQNLERGTAI